MPDPITSRDVARMKLSDIKKDATLTAAILVWAKARSVDENWFFLFAKGNAPALWKKYIKPGAEKEINIDFDLRDRFRQAAEAKDEAGFQALMPEAKKAIWSLATSNMQGFDKHEAVIKMNNDRQRPDLEKELKKSAAKALKLLGFDKSSETLLITYMVHCKLGEDDEAKKALKKIDAKAKHDELVKTLKKANLM